MQLARHRLYWGVRANVLCAIVPDKGHDMHTKSLFEEVDHRFQRLKDGNHAEAKV